MPRTVLDAATVEESLSGLGISMGSIANIGLILIGIILSVSLISTIFKRLFLNKIDGFHPPRPRSKPGPSSDAFSQVQERDLSSVFHRQSSRRGGDRL